MADANYEYYKENKALTSDFNQAKFEIYRLNNIWESFTKAIHSGNFMGENGANWKLDDIFGELSTDAEEKDKEKEKKQTYHYKIDKLNKLIAQYKNNHVKLYKILRMKEKVLRRLQDEAGKGSKRSYTEDEDDIDT